jgi:tyrosyl-tRNA synthetase
MQAWSTGLEPDELRALEGTLPTTAVDDDGLPVRLVDLLVRTELTASKSAAGRLVRQGGAYVNDQKIEDEDHQVEAADFIDGRWVLLRAGKRQRHLVVRTSSG